MYGRETELDLQKQTLYVSTAWGDRFLNLLGQKDPLWQTLSPDLQDQLRNALERFNIPGIINLVGEQSEQAAAALFRIKGLPEVLIGARVGQERSLGARIEPTSDAVLLEIQHQLIGFPEDRRLDLRIINSRLAGEEKDTVVLILDFDKLSPAEQEKLLNAFRQDRLSKCKIVICSSSSIEIPPKKRFGLF